MFLKKSFLVCSMLLLLPEVLIAQAVPPPIPPPPPPGLPIDQGLFFLMAIGLLYGFFLMRKTLKNKRV
jgi:hypothetical protein